MHGCATRYPDDAFDRFWTSPAPNNLTSIKTSLPFILETDPYMTPLKVMEIAIINPISSRGIQWTPSGDFAQDSYFFMCIHFAELKKLDANETREFDITLDGGRFYGPMRPSYLKAMNICSPDIYRTNGDNLVELNPTKTSTLSPILNAIELYTVVQLPSSATEEGDSRSLLDIMKRYLITKIWTGDPCLPRNYTWEGLVCSNDTDTSSPRIISLNLAGNNLTGTIPYFLANLTQLRDFEEARLEMSPGRCQAFTFKEVEKITDNFRQKIGKGGFGPVYLGRLKGQKVAVKVSSDESKQGFKEFHNEVNVMVTSSKFVFGLSVALLCHQVNNLKHFLLKVELLSRVHYKHVVSFLGYCHDAKRMILIYEYLSRGSLEDALSGQAQSANILLNDKLEAKIADFGLSKPVAPEGVTHVTTAIKGTPGYLDPEYYGTCCLNEKSDVYSFGIVLLELVSGKRHVIDVPSGEKINIAHWVRQSVLKDEHANIADRALCGRYKVDSLRRVVDLALQCTRDKGVNRPKMCDVVTELKEAISIDCGSLEESYVDPKTNLPYFSDSKIMKFGEIKSHDSNYIDGYPKYLWRLRTFPKGNRTCYKLQLVTPGSKYLIRPNFLYGNFDGLNLFPVFDLYLENTCADGQCFHFNVAVL
ncbi:hypothetical protein EJ110_NYTH24051 [Nymphaea thermarum]|nr:hypothetical protein EJ110_NYTH24051 [Nymphaea thermarum]